MFIVNLLVVCFVGLCWVIVLLLLYLVCIVNVVLGCFVLGLLWMIVIKFRMFGVWCIWVCLVCFWLLLDDRIWFNIVICLVVGCFVLIVICAIGFGRWVVDYTCWFVFWCDWCLVCCFSFDLIWLRFDFVYGLFLMIDYLACGCGFVLVGCGFLLLVTWWVWVLFALVDLGVWICLLYRFVWT